jgi:hypothetical protein
MKKLLLILIFICIFLTSCRDTPTVQTFTATPANTLVTDPTDFIEPSLEANPTEVTEVLIEVQTSTPYPTSTPELEYYFGDTVQQKGYGLTAVSIQDPYYTNLLRITDAAKKHIAIEVIISNFSGPPFSFNNLTLYGYLKDVEGYVYPIVYQGTRDPIIRDLVIDAGEHLPQRLVFEISKDTQLDSIELFIQPINFTTDLKIYTSLRIPPEDHEALQLPVSNLSPSLLDLPALGSSIEKLGVSLKLTDINPDNKVLYKAGYKFVAVNLELENIANIDRINVNREDFFLIDEDGFLYPASEGVLDELPEIVLDIGGKTKGWVIFGIPVDANPYGIKYSVDPELNIYIYAGLFN